MSTLRRLIIIVLLISLSACSGGGSLFPSPTPVPPTDTPEPPTATPVPMALTVNSDGITLEEFNAELARYKASQVALGIQQTDQQAAGPVIDDFVNQLLLVQGAREAGFTLDDAGLQARIDALVSQLGSADKLATWQQAHGYTDISFRAALKREAAAAWMRDQIASKVPASMEQVHIRQILFYNQDAAQNYLNQLQAGASFDDLAAQADPLTLGDLGWIARGYLPEKAVEDAAFALEPGKYSDIVKDTVGFHIIELIERQADRLLSPDELLALQNRAVEDWLADRRQHSSVVLAPK